MNNESGHSRIKLAIVILLVFGFFYILYSNLTYGLKVNPIEIKNICTEESLSCTRKFDVPTYFEDLKKQWNRIPRNQTAIEKLAGVTPDIFTYTIEFQDASELKAWKGQHPEILPNPSRGKCPFSKIGVIETKEGGHYEEKFGLNEITGRLRDLATALNDCEQYLLVFPPEVDSIERTEKYNIFIKLGFWSYISLLILSISLASLMLSIVKSLYKFIAREFPD